MAKVDRKQQIIDAAVILFANQGYYKTTTAHVAHAVGVTQPYVFHFFKSKEELFIDVLERSVQRIASTFHEVEAPANQLLERMGEAFYRLLETYRDETLLFMQAFTTIEPVIRAKAREGFDRIHKVVKRKFEQAQLPNPGFQATSFIGMGMAAVLSEVLELPELSPYCEEES